MGLENSATAIDELNPAWPLGTDSPSQGDDHLRLIKAILQADAASLSRLENIFGGDIGVAGDIAVAGLLQALGGAHIGAASPDGGDLSAAAASVALARVGGWLLELKDAVAEIRAGASIFRFDALTTPDPARVMRESDYDARFVMGANQAIISNQTYTLAVPVGLTPKDWGVRLQCINAHNGFAVGERVEANMNSTDAATNRFNSLRFQPANSQIALRTASSTESFASGGPANGNLVALPNGNWQMALWYRL